VATSRTQTLNVGLQEIDMNKLICFRRLILYALLLTPLTGCLAPYKNYQRVSAKEIEEYYSTPPKRPFEEVRRLSITFRELGYFTGRGSDEMMIGMLKDKAAALNADAIMGIQIASQPAGGGEWNLIWNATALAIRYTGQAPRYVERPSPDLPPNAAASGTGFLITTNGVFLTANHVLEGGKNVSVRFKGQVYPATVVGRDPVNDVAVLKVTCDGNPLVLISSRTAKLGADVLTLGFPNLSLQGMSPKLTRGSLSAVAGINDDPRHFQISVPIQPGNSGGPLVNMAGDVVGLIISKLSDLAAIQQTGTLPQSVNYALKSDYIVAFLSTLGIASSSPQQGGTVLTLDEVVKRLEDATGLVVVEAGR